MTARKRVANARKVGEIPEGKFLSLDERISRRAAIGRGAAVGAAVAAGLVIGGAGGYLGGSLSAGNKTVTSTVQGSATGGATQTVTQTATQTATQTVTNTVTQSVSGGSTINTKQLNFGMNISAGDSTDPAVTFTLVCDYICENVYEGLVRVEYPNTTPVLNIAKSVSVASDNVTWTADLNQNVTFANGDPVTAADFVYSWTRGIQMGSTASAANEWIVGTMGLKSASQITAPSTYTLQWVLNAPIAPSLVMGLLATPPFSVLNQKQIAPNVTNNDFGTGWLQNNSAGTAPYVLTQWVKNTNFTLKANPSYWGPNPAQIPNILIQHVADSTTEINGLTTGTYDIAWDPTPTQAQSLFWGPSTAVQEQLQPRIYYVWLNAAQPPFNNPAVNNALKWAIDYNGIVNNVLDGFGQTWQTLSFPNLPGADPSTPYSYDPSKAKSLLASAGYPNGFNMTIYEANDQLTQGVVETVQSNLADVGVNATINNQPISTTIAEAQKGQIQALIAGWGGAFASMANLIPAWTSPSANSIASWFGWNDPQAVSLTNQWYAAPDDATANSVASQLTQYCLTNAPFIIFFDIEAEVAQRSYVGGFYIPNPEIFVDYRRIYKLPVTS